MTPSQKWVAAAAATALALAVPVVAAQADRTPVTISVLSGRADLVSGGSSLVAIDGPDASKSTVTVDGRDVTPAFAVRRDGRFEGLVSGLKLGPNELRATLPNGHGASIALVNHPNGGPVFSGPQ